MLIRLVLQLSTIVQHHPCPMFNKQLIEHQPVPVGADSIVPGYAHIFDNNQINGDNFS
jgi:hypothetical protein